MNTNYIIISPVRDEAKYIRYTIESVISQTVRPFEWIIVNDGSTDSTGDIIDKYAKVYSWIRCVHRSNRGFRKAGGGVIEAFYDGYEAQSKNNWEYIVKLDGDLSFEKNYFEQCFIKFEENHRLGITGGGIYHKRGVYLELEKQPLYHVRGATKIYKRACWEAIGGLLKAPGWDVLDEIKANMLGWETRSFPELQLRHHRYTGGAEGSWRDAIKNGLCDYICGYHPAYQFIKCIKNISRKPYFVCSIGLFYGFLSGYLKGVSQVDDKALIAYLRRQQLRKLTFRSSILK